MRPRAISLLGEARETTLAVVLLLCNLQSEYVSPNTPSTHL
jgi:hypothetical protein